MKEAYAAYDSALVYNPSNIGALNNYAYYLSVERRDLDKAEEMSYKTVKAASEQCYLSWILMLGFFLRRETMLRPVSILTMPSRIPNRKKRAAWLFEHCGIFYFMTGDVEGALKYWKKALELGTESKTLKQKNRKKEIQLQNEKEVS